MERRGKKWGQLGSGGHFCGVFLVLLSHILREREDRGAFSHYLMFCCKLALIHAEQITSPAQTYFHQPKTIYFLKLLGGLTGQHIAWHIVSVQLILFSCPTYGQSPFPFIPGLRYVHTGPNSRHRGMGRGMVRGWQLTLLSRKTDPPKAVSLP